MKTQEMNLKEMSHDEFHDWLIFHSPEHETHYKVIQILRYTTATAIDDYVTRIREAYNR